MPGLSDFSENLVLTWLFTASAATRPTAWHAALHLNASPPTESAPSTGEVGAGVGYARQSIGALTISGTNPTQAANSGTLTFGPNTTTNWGLLGSISVWEDRKSVV